MKKLILLAVTVISAISMSSCASSEKALSWVDVNGDLATPVATVNRQSTSTRANAKESAAVETIKQDAQTKSESVEVVFGDASNLKNYNVIVGVFSKIDNAKNYYTRMADRGYTPLVVMNPNGLYRVVAYSSDSAAQALEQRNYIRTTYASDGTNLCDRAWILIPQM